MSETKAIRKHEEIHGVGRERGVDDDRLHLRVVEVVQTRQDNADPSLCWYALKRNGTGEMRWLGKQPGVLLDEFCKGFVRELASGVALATHGTWIVAVTDWNEHRPGYDTLMMLWKDADGDIPFSVEAEIGQVTTLLLRRTGLAKTCFDAWVRYAEQLQEAGIMAEHTSRFALGEGGVTH